MTTDQEYELLADAFVRMAGGSKDEYVDALKETDSLWNEGEGSLLILPESEGE